MNLKKTLMPLAVLSFFAAGIAAQPIPGYLDETRPVEERIEDALSRMTLEEKIAMIHAQSKFSTPGVPRLGIPEVWMSDGPHGVRMEIDWDTWAHAGWTNDSCTAFPALTCLAATFNPAMAMKYGLAVGAEARWRRKDILLGPGVNIYRMPLNGRNFEYFSEDPLLTSKMVVPYIRGLQSNGVAACVKHYALNNQEVDRNMVDVEVSDRALYEIYLPAFKAAVVDGGVWALMGSYNKYRGRYATHHERLTNEILKGEWGFDGVVVTDWGSAHDTREAALYGLDMEMGTWTDGLTWGESFAYDRYYMARPYLEAIRNGELPESTLDEKVRRVLRLNYRTNMNRNRPWGSFTTPEHMDAARQIAEEGVVLLKNEKEFFPIEPGRYGKILVVGENATRSLTEGGGSSELKPRIEVSPLEGMRQMYGEGNIMYAMGYGSGPTVYDRFVPSPYDGDALRAEAVEMAKQADVVLIFGGLNKNYQQDCEGGDRTEYGLPFGQEQLIEEITRVNPNTGLIIISGNAVSMPWIERVPAIMQSWYLGSQAGTAMANLISGKATPSGKLPFSIPFNLTDNGAMHYGEISYPGVDKKQVYLEDIYVGYRWHDTKNIPARYPFGYGISYTEFAYGRPSADKKVYSREDTVTISVDVSNTGSRDGAEVVQVYVSQKSPKLERPVKELKGFSKKHLKAGETSAFTVDIPVRDFAYFDDTKHEWVVDNDKFTLHVGSSSTDIRGKVTVEVK